MKGSPKDERTCFSIIQLTIMLVQSVKMTVYWEKKMFWMIYLTLIFIIHMTHFLDFLKVSDGLNRNYLADGNHDIDKLAAAAYGRTEIFFLNNNNVPEGCKRDHKHRCGTTQKTIPSFTY